MRSLENDKENARRKGIGIRAKLLMVEELKKVIYGRNDALSAYSFFHDSEDMSGENAQFLGALKINTDEEVPFEQYYLKTKEYYENKMTARQKLQGHNKTKSQ
ncbi:MAG: hypothetical protein Q8O89_07570 [Nanoarchaeota archaeon]|nr:hypothetical protein [Nanoarchaeota archaeon]